MSYNVIIFVDFPRPPAEVYDAFADLSRWHLWVHDLTSISPPEPMHPGLRFTTETRVLGRTNRSVIVVRDMVPAKLIVIQSQAGLIDYKSEYHFAPTPGDRCRLTVQVHLSFPQSLFNLARPVVEATAEAQVRGYLEELSSMMAAGTL